MVFLKTEKIIIICLTVFILFFSSFAFCQEAQIKAGVDTREVTIGDVLRYSVFIELPAEAQIKDAFPSEGKLGEFEIRDFKPDAQKEGAQAFRLEYSLSVFKTGLQSIPEYKIEYRGSEKEKWQALTAPAVNVKVQSVLGEEKEPALKPLKPKVIIWRDHLLWMIGLLITAAGAWAFFRFWKKKQKAASNAVIADAAHIIALRELEQLKKEDLIARGMMEEYYQRLSGCLRRYLENRFFLRAPWMSTEEFLKEARTSSVLDPAQRAGLKDFLLLSDLVKFARYGSSAHEASAAFDSARSFIEQTKKEEPLEEKSHA